MERGKWKEERGKRKEERGKRKVEREKRKEKLIIRYKIFLKKWQDTLVACH